MPPNVLLVILDSVRAKNCGLYGHENDTTPFLEEFASGAHVFEQARSPGTESITSHASIFSGHHVEEHNVRAYNSQLPVAENVWSHLGDRHGYVTGLFSPNVIVTESSNLHEPFDVTFGSKKLEFGRFFKQGLSPADPGVAATPRAYLREALDHGHPLRSLLNGATFKTKHFFGDEFPVTRMERADVYVESFLDWMGETDGPWAACLNFMDAHYPYVPEPEFDRWGGRGLRAIHDSIDHLANEFMSERPWGHLHALEALYDGCILQMDHAIESLIDAIRARGAFEDTLIVITSDHGQGFGERSFLVPDLRLVAHNWGIGEGLVHVPLVVKEPNQQNGSSISAPASLTYFRNAVEATLEGQSGSAEFANEESPVISSNFIQPPAEFLERMEVGTDVSPQPNRPWRAIYERERSVVRKHASWGPVSCTIEVPDAQNGYVVSTPDAGYVDSRFDEILDQTVVSTISDTRTVDDSVERRLRELGYST